VDENEAKAQVEAGNGDDDDEEEDPDGEVNFGTIKSTFAHDKDAIDFSEDNDLAVDNTEQEMFSNRYLKKGLSAVRSTATTAMKSAGAAGGAGKSRLDSMDEDYDEEGTDDEASKKAALAEPLSLLERQQMYLVQEQQQQGTGAKSTLLSSTSQGPSTAPLEPVDVQKLYPAFEPNRILKFSELFNTKRSKRAPHPRGRPGMPYFIVI
jgi:hypothetical protein